MDAKKYLGKLKEQRIGLRERVSHIEDMKAGISYIKGMSYNGVRVQSSPDPAGATLKRTETIADLEAALTADWEDYNLKRRRIVLEIEALPTAKYQEVLLRYYVEMMSPQEIADEMNYSYDWVRHLRDMALDEFQEIHKDMLEREQDDE